MTQSEQDLLEIEEADLDQLGLKPLQRRRFARLLQVVGNVGRPVSQPPAPLQWEAAPVVCRRLPSLLISEDSKSPTVLAPHFVSVRRSAERSRAQRR
jgi:hypothetical protein